MKTRTKPWTSSQRHKHSFNAAYNYQFLCHIKNYRYPFSSLRVFECSFLSYVSQSKWKQLLYRKVWWKSIYLGKWPHFIRKQFLSATNGMQMLKSLQTNSGTYFSFTDASLFQMVLFFCSFNDSQTHFQRCEILYCSLASLLNENNVIPRSNLIQ